MRKLILLALVAALLTPFAFGDADGVGKDYREKARALADSDVTGHYLLGLWCRKAGLADEARLEFERVIALSPDHAGARSQLGYELNEGRWLTREEAMRAKGLVLYEGTWMLPEEVARILLPEQERTRIKEEEARTRQLLEAMLKGNPKVERIATRALAGIEDRCKVEPLAYALRYPSENVRKFAASELGRIGDRRALRPLVYRSLLDTSEPVRQAALAAVKDFDDPNILAPYVNALFSENPTLQKNAAQAIGDLGDIRGVRYLIYRYSAHGGGHTRSHIYNATQLSFIQDFDVEVAQTAFIADPIVGILQEGQVLDVRVISTEGEGTIVERQVIRHSLKRLTGQDFGDDVAAWSNWWNKNKRELLAAKN